MPRKAYSEQKRDQVKEALLAAVIECIMDRGTDPQQHRALVQKSGYFQDVLLQFFLLQGGVGVPRPALPVAQTAAVCPVPDGGPRAQLAGGGGDLPEKLLLRAKSGVAVLSIEEEQQVRRCLSEENFRAFRRDQVSFMGSCSPSLASRWTALSPDCSATWP